MLPGLNPSSDQLALLRTQDTVGFRQPISQPIQERFQHIQPLINKLTDLEALYRISFPKTPKLLLDLLLL